MFRNNRTYVVTDVLSVYIALYNELPHEYARRAIINLLRDNLSNNSIIPKTLAHALNEGFNWAHSPEGGAFWSTIVDLSRKKDFSNLPIPHTENYLINN